MSKYKTDFYHANVKYFPIKTPQCFTLLCLVEGEILNRMMLFSSDEELLCNKPEICCIFLS